MRKKMNKEKLLFLAPKRDNYYKHIQKALIEIGYEVDCYIDQPNNIFYKILNSLWKKLGSLYRILYYQYILLKTNKTKYEYLFLLRAAGIKPVFIKTILNRNPEIKTIMCQWDSLQNHNYENLIELVDEVYSFDPEDCEKDNRLNYLPDFFIETFSKFTKTDVVFIGGQHGDRYRILNYLREEFLKNDITYDFFLYISFPLMIRERFRVNRKYSREERQFFRYRRINAKTVYNKVNNARIVLDIHSATQSGLTMRTMEALGMGKKLITTNENIKNEPFYDPELILIIDRNNIDISAIIDFCRRRSEKERQIEKLSVLNWTKRIFKTDSLSQ